MERVSVVFCVKTPGVKVELQPPPDKDYWQEKLHALLAPLGDDGNAFRCCLCGSMEEVSNHLWTHQTIYMHLKSHGDGDAGGEANVAVPISELLDTSADFSSGRYTNDVVLEEEALDGKGVTTIGISLEAVRDFAGTPISALRPSQPEAFLLELEAPEETMQLAMRAGREASSSSSSRWQGLRLRFGGVEQALQEASRCTLVLVSEWREVARALTELDVCLQIPSQDASDHDEIHLDMSPLIDKVDAPGGTEVVSAGVKTISALHPEGKMPVFEFTARVRAVRWVAPGRPVEPARSKDTQLWVDGLATDSRKWRLSLEIRSLRLTASTGNVYVAYQYEPLQQPRPFRTNPPTLARKNNAIYLPHAFSAYMLTSTHEELRAQLEEPIRIEVWNRDMYRKDDLIGLVDAGLGSVFEKPLQYSQSMPSMVRGFKVLDQNCPVVGTVEASNPRIGQLRLMLYLEDLGPAACSQAPLAPRAAIDASPPSVAAVAPAMSAPAQESPATAAEGDHRAGEEPVQEGLRVLRGSAAYSTAYELELWKRAEEEKFRTYLADQEAQQREMLEEEYRQQELARASEFRHRQGQMRDLEAKARKKLQELQQREIAMAAEESRMSLLRDELKRRTDRTIEDFEDASKRQVAEAQQTVQLERSRCRHLESRVAELEGELGTARQRAREFELDFDERRRRLEDLPAAQMQHELQAARLELEDMRRRADALAASRDHFKQKVEELCKRLMGNQASPDASVLDSTTSAASPPMAPGQEMPEVSSALRKIQHDLAHLAQEWSASPPQQQLHVQKSPGQVAATPVAKPGVIASPTHSTAGGQQQAHLEWLVSQREELLESGLYTETDPVLVALDGRIAEAVARLH